MHNFPPPHPDELLYSTLARASVYHGITSPKQLLLCHVLKSNDIQISMDGKGRWVDNVMVERLWRSVKYEEVYLKAYSNVLDAKKQLNAYFEFYNLKRPHSSLDMRSTASQG